MANDTVKFLPIRGTEAQIEATPKKNGQFYIATDTGKIFADISSEERIVLGSSGVSLHYANVKPTQDTATSGIVIYLLNPLYVEDSATLKENDLILNKNDGCFYQVVGISNSAITTIQLAVSGGGGGGSGGGGGGSYNGIMRFSPVGNTTIDVLEGQSCELSYNFSAVDATGDPTGAGEGIIFVNNVQKGTFVAKQGVNTLDVTEYLETAAVNNIILQVTGDIGTIEKQTQRKSWTVTVIRMTTIWDYEETDLNTEETFTFRWQVQGNRLHQTHINIDDGLYELLPPASSSTFVQTYTINRAEYGLTHGAHKVTIYATTEINDEDVPTNAVTHTVLIADTNNNIPIVAIAYYQTTSNQYDAINIPILVYDPTALSTVSVDLRDNGELVDTLTNITNGTEVTWSYTALTAGTHRLSVSLGNSADYLDLEVAELEINETGREVANYAFKFAANAFTSNEAVKNWESNGVHFTFSENFDWINGGLKQEYDEHNNLRNYLCVKAGSSVTLNHKFFNTLESTRGKVFKFIFKATNCRDYDAQVLNCYDDEQFVEHPRGLLMRAQNAVLGNSANKLNIPYCEDSFIEFEFDIWGTQTAYGGHRYIIPWLDGVPAGIQTFDTNTLFTQNKDIVIGSADCDVYIYLIKVYNFHLTDDQHLANFIADALNSQEMLARYNRNNILDDQTGDISMTKLALANPNIKVHAYEIDRMTTTKEDPIEGCSYRQYQGSANPELTAENVTIKVQGTSSAKYGEAAFNLDSDFIEGFTDANLQHFDKYAMTPNSIPVSYFNTKVNVASCEQANNALNQRWYNQFQPFICEYRAKNSMARDTMEFPFPGVLFIKDKNQTLTSTTSVENNVFRSKDPTDHSYINSPYYKMYSICNMGNSKKNKTVFHDPDNLYESCVEVADNQTPQQWMTSLANVDRDNIEGDYYEFRYVPKSKKVEHSHAWYDFVDWLMHCDPSPYNASSHPYGYTGEDLDEPETYGSYTFRGYTSAITEYKPDYEILAGKTISTYAGTYTKDTYERRMAKFLSECEDHMVMDAVVFHYLMCERHCLIDNIAKNTFWATEDMQHWAMIKDYDNDTSDGNDNEGKLTLTYGLEMLDQKASGSFVFNAPNSVWLHAIDGLYEARKAVYNALDIKGAWDDQAYLQMFEAYQSAIPERCWIEDYWRKYIRPLEVYNNDFFLDMLEGGKKTHQRKQFEKYQAAYMASEYMGNACLNNFIVFRGEDANVEAKFNITMYSDCYIQIEIGQQWVGPQGRGIRVKRNTPVEIVSPVQEMKDATMNFYLATYITRLTGLSTAVPQTANIGSAIRLREFGLGGQHINGNLNSITFGANTLLETMDLTNCTAINGALDLSQLLSLKTLDTRGSSFSGVTIASNAPVETLHLNDMSTLDLSNLYHLTTFDMEDYTALKTLIIDNIDNSNVNSLTIAKLSTALDNYSFKNIQWTLNSTDEMVADTAAAIKILNYLLTKTPSGRDIAGSLVVATRAEALTGTINITETAYNGSNALDIYNYYSFSNEAGFPNADLIFEGSNAQLYTVDIYDGYGDICWSKKSDGEAVNATFLASGPYGDFGNIDISNYQDMQYTYTFDNKWNIYNNTTGALITQVTGEQPSYGNFMVDLKIQPVYISTPRLYNLTFVMPNAEGGNNISVVEQATYGTTLADVISNAEFDTPYKDASALAFNKTYIFKGFSLLPTNGIVLNNNRYTVNSDATFYAQFEEGSVYEDVHPEWFDFTPATFTDTYDSKYNVSGWKATVKSDLTLKGKVVIPIEYNGQPVVAVGRFGYNASGNNDYTNIWAKHSITHILFERKENVECKIRTFDTYFAYRMHTLKYIELASIRVIPDYAFVNTELEVINGVFEIGPIVCRIGEWGFNNAFTETTNVIIHLTSECRELNAGSFSYNLLNSSILEIGEADNGSLLNMNNGTSSNSKIATQNQYAWAQVFFYTDLYVASGSTQFDLVDESGVISSYGLADSFGFANSYTVQQVPHSQI